MITAWKDKVRDMRDTNKRVHLGAQVIKQSCETMCAGFDSSDDTHVLLVMP
jgi:hypothetical protein